MTHPLQGDALQAARQLDGAAKKRSTPDETLERLWKALGRFRVKAEALYQALSPKTVERLDVQIVGGRITCIFDRAAA